MQRPPDDLPDPAPASAASAAPADLAGRVRRWAQGRPGIEPAVLLLAATGWFADRSFVEECVQEVDESVACVDWAAVRTFSRDHAGRNADGIRALQLAHTLARTAWDPEPGLRTARD